MSRPIKLKDGGVMPNLSSTVYIKHQYYFIRHTCNSRNTKFYSEIHITQETPNFLHICIEGKLFKELQNFENSNPQ